MGLEDPQTFSSENDVPPAYNEVLENQLDPATDPATARCAYLPMAASWVILA